MTIFLYLLTVVIWGTTWIAIKFQLGEVAPAVSVFYRFALATFLLAIYCKSRKWSLKFPFKDHIVFFFIGLSMFSIHLIFVYKASLYLISGLVSVLFSFVSLFNILNAYLFFKKKATSQVLLGALLGLAGITVFFLDEITHFSLQTKTLMGALCALLGAWIFSLGNILSYKHPRHGTTLVTSITISMCYGSLILLCYIFLNHLSLILPLRLSYWGSLLYLVIPGSIIGFLSYLSVIARIGPEKAGYATVISPIVALLCSLCFEDYRLGVTDIVGILLIVAGNCFVAMSGRQKAFKIRLP